MEVTGFGDYGDWRADGFRFVPAPGWAPIPSVEPAILTRAGGTSAFGVGSVGPITIPGQFVYRGPLTPDEAFINLFKRLNPIDMSPRQLRALTTVDGNEIEVRIEAVLRVPPLADSGAVNAVPAAFVAVQTAFTPFTTRTASQVIPNAEWQSVLLDVKGQFPTAPVLRIQPTAQRTTRTANVGWSYRRRYVVSNADTDALTKYAVAIDLGDTAALVTGGKALASGDDLRVWIGGKEVARTLNTWNGSGAVGTSTSTLCWVTLPSIPGGGSVTVDVMYGNPSAGAPPTLTYGVDLPAFDIATTGAGRSTNTKWVYAVSRTAANAGKGIWPISGGNPLFAVPGAWQVSRVTNQAHDMRQEVVSSYVDASVTYQQGRFDAQVARAGASVIAEAGNDADGVMLRAPVGITQVRADFRWLNPVNRSGSTVAIGRLALASRDSASQAWQQTTISAATAATETAIAAANYVPSEGQANEVALALLPISTTIPSAADGTRRAYAFVDATLEVTLQGDITQNTPAEETVYEVATELRHGGGGDTAGLAVYKSVLLGNAKGAAGAGTPRLAVLLNQQIVVRNAERVAEIWNSALTAKVANVPTPAARAVSGVRSGAATIEQPASEWIAFVPVTDPLLNSSATTDVLNWTRGTVTAGVTTAFSRVTATFDTTPAAFQENITANTAGAGAIIEDIATDYLPVGDRQHAQVGMAIRTTNVNLQPTPSIWWYDAAQAPLAATPKSMQADWAIPDVNTWYRRLFAAAVPAGAAYFRVGVTSKDKVGGLIAVSRWDTVAVNDTEIAVRDVAQGANLTFSAEWEDRYAYA